MANDQKIYDLEERTFQYAKNTVLLVKKLPKNISNIEYGKQVIRSTASSGANYIEANESLGKKDFAMRIRICRKEAKESAYWFRLLAETNLEFAKEINLLLEEAIELKKIFSSMLKNC